MMAVDNDRSSDIYAASIVAAVIGIIFAGARIYSNMVLLNRKHREDWIIALSSVRCFLPI